MGSIAAVRTPSATPPAEASSRRLRVLALIDSISVGGGAERLAAEILLHLDPTRFDRTICATRTHADDEYLTAFAREGVRVLRLNRRNRFDLGAWLQLLPELRATDVLHTHKFGSNVWGAALGRLARVPVIVAHEHTWSYRGEPLRRFLDRELIARAADVLVMVSRADRQRAYEVERIDFAKTRYLPNGTPSLRVSGFDIRAELGIGVDAPVVGTVSALRPQKAFGRLLRAAAALRVDHPDLAVLMAGYGPEEHRLRRLADELRLDGTVHFLGRRTDIGDILAAVDVAVCCSDYEGLPLSVLEYMSAGKAIVATAVGGVPDLIVDGVHGLLVDVADERAFVSAVSGLLRDPARRAELGRAAQSRQQEQFTIENAVARFERLYDELHAARRR